MLANVLTENRSKICLFLTEKVWYEDCQPPNEVGANLLNVHFISFLQRRMSMRNQSGFTLIELVVVIVILGLLAAVAIPKFSDLRSDARSSSLKGLAGGIRSAAALARAQYKVNGNDSATTVTMDGDSVTVIAGSGYPSAVTGGIDVAMESY
jgi:prepilin-type N-terminal cleavage/methylation domain-containing protein